MEFLLVWILSGNVLDSGLRYDDAASCYASAQNGGMELKGRWSQWAAVYLYSSF
jgi:hypothetical protein